MTSGMALDHEVPQRRASKSRPSSARRGRDGDDEASWRLERAASEAIAKFSVKIKVSEIIGPRNQSRACGKMVSNARRLIFVAHHPRPTLPPGP